MSTKRVLALVVMVIPATEMPQETAESTAQEVEETTSDDEGDIAPALG
jgi:hypothetical protein